MDTQQHSALYYPSIEFTNPEWLWASSLIWDRVYRNSPQNYTPEDADNVKELTDAGEIGIPIHPDSYATDVAEHFVNLLRTDHWRAAALDCHMEESYARLHADKVDVQLRKMMIAQGKALPKEHWLHVPTDFEALYMTYLATHISKTNGLNLVTDSSGAWSGATYFSFDGKLEEWINDESRFILASIVIRDFIPTNILDIRPSKLLAFREKYRDERHRFVNAIRKAAADLSNCRDETVARDIYEDIKRDAVSCMRDYKRSMDILKVQGWTGLKTIVFPAAAQIIGKLFPIEPVQLTILSATGLAMGAIAGLASMNQKAKKLAKEHEYSYLVRMDNMWKHCLHGNDWNYLLYRQIEEFIND